MREIKIRVKNTECGSDAIDRYMRRKGYEKKIWQKADAVREFYIKGHEVLAVQGQYIAGKNVIFELGLA